MKYLISLITLSIALTDASAHTVVTRMDSVGHKWVNGKLFVLHQVEAGQTLYAVSRRYGTSVAAIKEANSGNDQLKVNTVIQVPYSRYRKPAGTGKETAAAPARPLAEASAVGTHTVEVGQTLYSIAARYGVSQADVRNWNDMQSDNIMLGQVLIVSGRKFSESRQPPMVTVAADSVKAMPVAEKVIKPILSTTVSPKEGAVRPVTQQGLAEKIDANESSTTKYLALHRDAPIGTLVEVKNEFNQEIIWAKVIGRIPDTSVNEDIVIKLSGRAFDKISPDTRRFRAVISYHEPIR